MKQNYAFSLLPKAIFTDEPLRVTVRSSGRTPTRCATDTVFYWNSVGGLSVPKTTRAWWAAMNDTEQLIPELYREAAEQVARLARRSRLTDVRGDLFELSASYERMATYIEAAIRLGAPGYPHGEILPIARGHSLSPAPSPSSASGLRSRELGHNRKGSSSSLRPSRGAHRSRSGPRTRPA